MLQGNLQQDYEHKIEQLTEDQKISKLCYDVGLKIVARGQLFITFAADRTPTHNTHLCSTVCSQARNAHHALGSREQPKHDLHFIFVRLIRVFVIWCVAHVSSMVALTCLSRCFHFLESFLMRIFGGERDAVMARTLSLSD